MTDKEQIIIDGVDVSRCVHLVDKEACGSMDCQSVECGKNLNCLFKQLARKTKECEELKAYAQRQENQREEYYKEYLKKDKALEEIQILTGKIISNDDQPACVYDVECPLNGGVGFDNHCNENCPFVIAKQILNIINKVKGGE